MFFLTDICAKPEIIPRLQGKTSQGSKRCCTFASVSPQVTCRNGCQHNGGWGSTDIILGILPCGRWILCSSKGHKFFFRSFGFPRLPRKAQSYRRCGGGAKEAIAVRMLEHTKRQQWTGIAYPLFNRPIIVSELWKTNGYNS
jgi:hypothetical protein